MWWCGLVVQICDSIHNTFKQNLRIFADGFYKYILFNENCCSFIKFYLCLCIDGLMQKRRNSMAKVLVLCLFCIKPSVYFSWCLIIQSWWRHQMETFSALLAHLCGEFTGPRRIPHTKVSDTELWCSFYLCLNKRLNKQWWGWWFETLSRLLWRHRNGNLYSACSTQEQRSFVVTMYI